MKPKIGFFDLTGCNGCVLSVVFNEDELLDMVGHIDLANFRLVNSNSSKKYDIAFVEGLVADKADLDKLKKIRAETEILVAFGTCAATGNLPAMRNYMAASKFAPMVYDRKKELKDEAPVPIHKHVKVEYTLPGCPPDRDELKTFIKDLLLGKSYHKYNEPVCNECRHNENKCLLIEEGKPCMGPITRGGCDSICVNGGFECWGCRGLTPDANIEAWTKLMLEKGCTRSQIDKRMKSFMATELSDIPKIELPKPKSIPVRKVKADKKEVKNMKKEKVLKKKLRKVKSPVKAKSVKKKPAKKKAKRKVAKKKVLKKKFKKKSAKKTVRKVKSPVKTKSVKKKSAKKKSVKKKLTKKKAKRKVAKKKVLKKKFKKKVSKKKLRKVKSPVKTKSVKKKPAKSKVNISKKKSTKKKAVKKNSVKKKLPKTSQKGGLFNKLKKRLGR